MALDVLVVDDSAMMRAIIIKTLRLSKLPLGKIFEAANGEQGLQALEDKAIGLLLVDINMPVMNGYEMIDRIRQNPKTANLPIIVVSTESSETRIEMVQRKGAGFIHKPFNPDAIGETVRRVIGDIDEQQNTTSTVQGRSPDF
jgi:two-component system chemotaxis response regulator CheY